MSELIYYKKRRRYYLHWQVKRKYKISPFRKSYTCTPSDYENIMHDPHLVELINEYGYSVQLKIS